MRLFLQLSLSLVKFLYFLNPLQASDYWWNKMGIGITVSHGKEQNRYDAGYDAADISGDFLSAWRIQSGGNSNIVPIGSIPTEAFFHFFTRNHRFMFAFGLIDRKPNILTSRSKTLYYVNLGNAYFKGFSSYEDTWYFFRFAYYLPLFESDLGRTSLGIGCGLGYTDKTTWHMLTEKWVIPDDGSDKILDSYEKRDVYFFHKWGESVQFDLKYDLPKIPVSVGILGQIYFKGGTPVSTWRHKITNMKDGEITVMTEKGASTEACTGYAAGLGGGYLFYIMGSLPL